MTTNRSGQRTAPTGTPSVAIVVLALIVCGGTIVRFVGLGGRSLWADEFSTWHVSRIPLGASLEWGPELTKPPLYQLVLRAVTRDPRPAEWLLRLPAAVAGVLTILASYAIARRAGGWIVGCSAGGLVAFHLLQVAYSQEARPYSFHVLGATIATLFWWRLVETPTRRLGVLYAVAAVFTFHSHYLSLLVFVAHVLWWAVVAWRSGRRAPFFPLVSLAAAGVPCVPVVVNYLRLRSSMFQGLSWIRPPTWSTAISVLNELGFGVVWTVALAGCVVVWIVSLRRGANAIAAEAPPPPFHPGRWQPRTKALAAGGSERVVGASRVRARVHRLSTGRDDVVGLLLIWLGCSWFGLMVLSWVAHPAMVARYALPAAIPVLLIPVIVGGRVHGMIPPALVLVFSVVGIFRWQSERLVFEPGFRELSAYLAETADPQRDLVVLTIDRQTHPDWIDAERLPFEYYPIPGAQTAELHLHPDGKTVLNEVLEDPRPMYLIVLWADPFAILEAAGRTPLPFEIEGRRYSRLLFSPYRVVRVAGKR